jgi:hypothetical protein
MSKTEKKTVSVRRHKRAKPRGKNKSVDVKGHRRTPPD